MWLLVAGQILLVHVHFVKSVSHKFDISDCRVSIDTDNSGNLIDCSDLDLSHLQQLRGLPHNTTTLILDRTNITCLHDNFFTVTNHSSLVHLSIRDANLATIKVNALFGLHNLKILNLERNQLPFCNHTSFPPGMFDHVPELRSLFIGFNIEYDDISSHCKHYQNISDIFSVLPHLTNLSIDAVSGELNLGEQFSNLTKLTNLTLVCNKVKRICNGSLQPLRDLRLIVLNLVAIHRADVPLESGTFQNLSHIQFLSVDGIHVSNHGILRALKPFANRNMTEIKLVRTNIFLTFNVPDAIFNDGIVDEDALFMNSICVRHFSWINSVLFAIKPNMLTSNAWPTCLQTLDLSKNKLENTGWVTVVFELIRLKNMKEISLSSMNSPPSEDIPKLVHFSLSDVGKVKDGSHGVNLLKYANTNYLSSSETRSPVLVHKPGHKLVFKANKLSPKTTSLRGNYSEHAIQTVPSRGSNTNHWSETITSREDNTTKLSETAKTVTSRGVNTINVPETSRGGNTSEVAETMTSLEGSISLSEIMASWGGNAYHSTKTTSTTVGDTYHLRFPYNGNLTYYAPQSMEKLKVINLMFAGVTLESWTVIVAGSSLREFYWINNELLRCHGVIYGLEGLKVAGFSGSDFDIADHFLDRLSHLEVLLLDNVRPDSFFHTHSLQRLLRNLTSLRYLDVSKNRLNSLLSPLDTFTSTPNITHIILSQNRFSNIPFSLETTPRLRVLDLSNNAILFLSDQEMLALNTHVARVGTFTLRLFDNGIACVCSQTRFFVWMYTTTVNLEQTSSFQCVTEDDLKVNVTDIDNLPDFIRLCEGRYFLMAAVILASVMIIVFLVALLVVRFKTSLEALLLRLFVRAFRPMGPDDYRIQVFIGYADDDFGFVRYMLLRYLEGELRETTFVHQRDLTSGFTDQLFYDAISNSWRVLLVLSRNFLTAYERAHNVMKYASHSVTAVNPHRVFVLLEESQLHAIPDYLDGLLEDTSIIVIPDLQHELTYQQKQMIRECLRPTQ